MKTVPITDRLWVAVFSDLSPFETNVIVYHGLKINLIIDTFLHPSYMTTMIDRLLPEMDTPPIIVNTHYHFDHVWGNAAFPVSIRMATPLCRQKMIALFDKERQQNRQYWKTDNTLCLPNCLITSSLFFPSEEIEIFPSPGHTDDACSVYFRQENVLVVGDNLEYPLPFLENSAWQSYLNTLDRYSSFPIKTIVAGHGILNRTAIEIATQYILAWQKNDTSAYEQQPYLASHHQNKVLLKELLHTATEQ